MNLDFTPEENAFRDEVRTFIKDNYPADLRAAQDEGRALTKEEYLSWHKVLAKKEASITEILSVDKEFGWTSNYTGFHATKRPNDVPLHYIKGGKRHVGWVGRTDVTKSKQLVDTWKVMIPQAGSDGGQRIPDSVLGQPLLADLPSVCTQSYLFFYLKSKEETESLSAYLQTKFFRFLVSLRKLTQHATRSTYTWVPQQSWDRAWTDAELNQKYGLTAEEVAFIDLMIRPMGTAGHA